MSPRLLDLFCGAGGCSEGYSRAGFEVVGVDINPQPHYPFEFVQADALTFPLDGFNAVHASPPCQGYSALRHMHPAKADAYPRLIEQTRERLHRSGLPYAIENVEGAPLHDPVLLCGSMFGLCIERGWLKRHRLFECSFPVERLWCDHPEGINAIGVYGNGGNKYKPRMCNRWEAGEALEIDWMNRDELTQAIPPVYTHHIGYNLRQYLNQ